MSDEELNSPSSSFASNSSSPETSNPPTTFPVHINIVQDPPLPKDVPHLNAMLLDIDKSLTLSEVIFPHVKASRACQKGMIESSISGVVEVIWGNLKLSKEIFEHTKLQELIGPCRSRDPYFLQKPLVVRMKKRC